MDVGCCVSCFGRACTGKLFDVLADLIAIVCHLIGKVVPVVSCCSAACVLLVGVSGFDNRLKMRLGKGEVCFWRLMATAPTLTFPVCQNVAVIDFFKVKLEFVVISDGAVRSNESTLVVVKALSKDREVFVGMVPLCVVCCF